MNAEPECNVTVLGSVNPELVRIIEGEQVVICSRESNQHLLAGTDRATLDLRVANDPAAHRDRRVVTHHFLGEREPEHVVRVLDHRSQASEVVGIRSQMPQARISAVTCSRTLLSRGASWKLQ
jgi:hypothetical protein